MIRTLQKRFVVSAMTAITLLLVLLLGIINIANLLYTGNETDRLLAMLSTGEALQRRRIPPNQPERRIFTPPPTEDTKMSAVYFTAKKGPQDSTYQIKLNRISSISESDAESLVNQAKVDGESVGKIKSFKYRLTHSPIDNTETYVFLDTTAQRFTVFRMAALSCLAGLAVWLLMLLLVSALSRRAILPIEKNFEKQKQFVTDAGHEIKTPLAIILANTEALELHGGENKWSKNIKAQVSRLDGLMKDLLTLAKSDETHTNIPKENINLSLILSECIDMFIEPAALRGIMIEHDSYPPFSFLSNKEYATRLISTLLDNAVKYSKAESSIFVSLSQSEKGITLNIKNECENLPNCDPEKLFDRFYRSDSARTQKNGGYGIGLSAAKAIATMLGGRVYAKYEGEKSIIFTVKL